MRRNNNKKKKKKKMEKIVLESILVVYAKVRCAQGKPH